MGCNWCGKSLLSSLLQETGASSWPVGNEPGIACVGSGIFLRLLPDEVLRAVGVLEGHLCAEWHRPLSSCRCFDGCGLMFEILCRLLKAWNGRVLVSCHGHDYQHAANEEIAGICCRIGAILELKKEEEITRVCAGNNTLGIIKVRAVCGGFRKYQKASRHTLPFTKSPSV